MLRKYINGRQKYGINRNLPISGKSVHFIVFSIDCKARIASTMYYKNLMSPDVFDMQIMAKLVQPPNQH